ncbi:MAG: hypothetical protein CL608_21840 [Anaerolineaceae bacterium]|nr:hypothetical protein [Anaerolineaceae bacterium]
MNGKVISGPAAILILFLFFLPWVAVSCEGMPQSELSGLQLAMDADAGGDPIFFIVPLAALVSLFLLASTLWKPAWETNANWGLVVAAIAGLLVFLLKWLQLRGNSGAFEVTILPALWVTVAGLLGIGLGAVFDLWRTPKQPVVSYGRNQPQQTPFHATPPQPRRPAPLDSNATMVDDAFSAAPKATMVDEGQPSRDPHATIVDDAPAPADDPSKRTLMDDDMREMGHPAFRFPGEDEDDFYPPTVAERPQPQIEPTEVLHVEPKTVAWLVIGNGEREGEQFELKAETTIGRDPNSDIFINDTALSALHVRVRLVDGRYIANDQNSTNGLFMYDARQDSWEKEDQIELEEGTQIKLGRTVLHFTTLKA